jgi:thiamine-phosphate pyrophosphorylase
LHVYIVHQLNASQSDTQRPFGAAQAPVAFLLCFAAEAAAEAGDNEMRANAPVNTMAAIDFARMELPPVHLIGQMSHNGRMRASDSPLRQMVATTGMTMLLPDPPLLVVTDRRQARRTLFEIVTAALAGGCRWISLREKDLPEDEQVRLARRLLPVGHRSKARLMLHGEVSLAKLAGADGVHLPSGGDAAAARALLGPGKLVGVSIHTVSEAAAIDPTAADYALAGPAFETPSKPGYGPEIGRKGLAEIARSARVPVLAIGGINAARIGEVIAAGCAGVAVMGGVMRAAEPAQEVAALVVTLNGYPRA